MVSPGEEESDVSDKQFWRILGNSKANHFFRSTSRLSQRKSRSRKIRIKKVEFVMK